MTPRLPIEVEVSLSFKQYLKLMFFVSLRRLVPIFLFVYIMLISIHYFNGYSETANYRSAMLSSFIIVPILLVFSIYLAAKKQFKNTPVLQQRTKYLFTDDRIELSGESFNSTLGWEMMIKAAEMGSFFLIYGSLNTAFFIPLSSFKSDEQISEFRSLLREKFGKKAKLKK